MDEQSRYGYVPNVAANSIALAAFVALTLIHVVLWRRYKNATTPRRFLLMAVLAGFNEAVGYALRILSVFNGNDMVYVVGLSMFFVSPIMLSMVLFGVVGEVVQSTEDPVYGWSPRWFMRILGGVDVLLVLNLQAVSFGLLVADDTVTYNIARGLLLTGLCVQVLLYGWIAWFVQTHRPFKARALAPVVHVVIGAIALLEVRLLYRVIEYATSPTLIGESAFFAFDTVPIVLVCVVFAVCHLGRLLGGDNAAWKDEVRAVAACSVDNEQASAFSLSRNTRALLKQPTATNRAAPLDGLRALAAIWVVSFHVWGSMLYTFPADSLDETDVQRYLAMDGSFFMRVVKNGELGVDMFFVLSGLLIMRILSRDMARAVNASTRTTKIRAFLGSEDLDSTQPLLENVDPSATSIGCVVREFFIRRCLRIVPVYLLVIIVGIGLEVSRSNGAVTTCADYFWRDLVFVQNFYPASEMCLVWTWSVAVEVQMYLVSPLIVWAAVRWPEYARIQLLALSAVSLALFMGLSAYAISGDPVYFGSVPVTSMFFTRLFAYTLGMLVAHEIDARKREISLNSTVSSDAHQNLSWIDIVLRVLSILLVLIVTFCSMRDDLQYSSRMAEALLTKPVFAAALAYIMYDALVSRGPDMYQEAINWILSSTPLYVIAQLSYSIYLLHLFLVAVFAQILQAGGAQFFPQWIFPVSTVFTLFITVLFSLVVYYAIEKPAINLGNDILRKSH